jgi:fibro-slime domain-containing protein
MQSSHPFWLIAVSGTLLAGACSNAKIISSDDPDGGRSDATYINLDTIIFKLDGPRGPTRGGSDAPPGPNCGNSELTSDEACDDGNTVSGDGCANNCLNVETGYSCPKPGEACRPVARCGDGLQVFPEQCDDGNLNNGDGCSAGCKVEIGWKCDGSPSTCTQTTCGDSNKEGAEGCDDGNTKPNDGCSPTCRFEPQCSSSSGTCTSKCGDGLVVNEGCDDGNTTDGDGCSHDCTVEDGFECNQPENTADTMTVPVTYRDFSFDHPDFENGINGSNNPSTGIVKDTLDSEGKPVFAGAPGDGHITSADTFKQWYRDVSGTNLSSVSTILLHNNGQGGFVNWWKDDQQWEGFTNVRWCETGTCANCNAPPYDSATMKCFAQCTPWGEGNTNSCVADVTKTDGNPLFFPIDKSVLPGTASQATSAKIPPIYGGNWMDEQGKPPHNFSFTSEVRYWFSYIAKNSYSLDFTGDDDVWVFVNRKLAVDIGGIHTPVQGKLVLNSTGGGTVTVTPTEGDACTTTNNVTTCKGTTKTVSLDMSDHGVYEIVVFQAERQTTASTYKLTLSGFNDKPSDCRAICGDGILAIGEECDDGVHNGDTGYGSCSTNCMLGDFCGDGLINGDEMCDDGGENGLPGKCPSGCRILYVP